MKHMSTYYIRDLKQAKSIISTYEHCSNCDTCTLNMPEGWRCSYLYELALRYIEQHPAD